MKIYKYLGLLFAVGAFFDATTTMLGTSEILSSTTNQDNKSFIIGAALVFALLITTIVASSEVLLHELYSSAFKKAVVLPTVIAAFGYDFYTSAYGVSGLILGEGHDLLVQETNMILIVLFLSLFMTMSPFIAIKLWSIENR